MAISALFRTAVTAGLQYFFARTLLAEVAVRRRAGRMLRGVIFVVSGVGIGCLAFGFLLVALFFSLAEEDSWVRPALVTGGLGLLIALLLVWEGVRVLRRE